MVEYFYDNKRLKEATVEWRNTRFCFALCVSYYDEQCVFDHIPKCINCANEYLCEILTGRLDMNETKHFDTISSLVTQ